jgi:hypothetical protein
MDQATLLDRASDEAFARLEAVGGDLAALPIPIQTVVVIYSAQGVIDNGGLEYFYENDWPGQPAYSSFSDAYRRIGAVEAAECIERTASLFPFAEPHRYEGWRRRFLERGSPPEFRTLSDRICGDETVWEKLAAYVIAHRSAFASAEF